MENDLTRRQFVMGTTAVVAAVGATTMGPRPARAASSIDLPPLPYPDNGLDPYISSNTLSFHYGKHHKAYVDTTNKLIEGTPFAGQPLEKIVASAADSPEKAPLFNAAAQVWNHSFYWNCLKPQGGGIPTGALSEAINKTFGSFDEFKSKFSQTAV